MSSIKIIGHRGAAGLALENSPAGLRTALALPLDAVELDVRRTKDGQLVIAHDKHMQRIAGQKLWIFNSTLAELKAIKLNNGETIMTLDEALDIIKAKMPVILDLKSGDIYLELVECLNRHPGVKAWYSSRNYPQLARLHKKLPDIPFIARSYIYSTDIVHIARRLGAKAISVNKWVLNPLTVLLAMHAKLEVQAYTVNSPLLVGLYKLLYPNIAIYTDYPGRFTEPTSSIHSVK